MPLRRSHTKSRKGCTECKRRHVKCDEEVPKCGLCKKRKLECIYPPDPESASDSLGRDSESGTRTAGGLPTGGDLPMAVRMLEIRLIHQYLTSTCHILAEDGLSTYHLSIVIPQMATTSPYLLDSILALSALHLASLEAENRDYWLDAASRYQSSSCSGLGRVLPEITHRHYEAAFVCSVFILIFATGFPVISLEGDPGDPVSRLVEVRTLLSGTSMLFQRLNEIGAEGELDGWLVVADTEEPLKARLKRGDEMVGENETQKLFDLHKTIMASLCHLEPFIEADESPNRVVFKATWHFTCQAIEPWPKIGAHGGVMAWPLFVSEEFIALLQKGDWTARILFLHYAVGMRLMSNRWYVQDWGRRLVLGTLAQGDEIPPIWQDTLSWMKHGVEISDGRIQV